jgi:hypothetical protein
MAGHRPFTAREFGVVQVCGSRVGRAECDDQSSQNDYHSTLEIVEQFLVVVVLRRANRRGGKMTAQEKTRTGDVPIASNYGLNTPDVICSLTADDAPEEFARRAMIRALEAVMWEFGIDPDSIFAMKMRRALNMGPHEYHRKSNVMVRRFACAECGAETITTNPTQKFCRPICSRDYWRKTRRAGAVSP